MYRITIAQKAYSSWSLRGWLLLAAFDLPFEEVLVPMGDPAFDRMRDQKAPARTVPVLEWDENGRTRRIWDTMAIAETLAERHPDAGLWPEHPWHRAVARTLAAEMHAGFAALRAGCPMNLHRVATALNTPGPGLDEEVARAGTLFDWAMRETGGPWLGGPVFSAVDAFYAPLASRLESYALSDAATAPYARRVLSHPSVAQWTAAARADLRRIDRYDSVT